MKFKYQEVRPLLESGMQLDLDTVDDYGEDGTDSFKATVLYAAPTYLIVLGLSRHESLGSEFYQKLKQIKSSGRYCDKCYDLCPKAEEFIYVYDFEKKELRTCLGYRIDITGISYFKEKAQ